MKGGPKTVQTQTQANTYGWQTPPSSPDVQAIRDFRPERDPTIPYNFAHERRRQDESFDDVLGGYSNANTRGAAHRTMSDELTQQEAHASRGAQYDVNNQRLAQLGTVADLTNPRLVQTGGSSTGTSQTSQSIWGPILGAAATVGAGAL